MIRVEIFADVICPWSYIGKRRLERAIAGRDDVEVIWRSFELGRDLPRLPAGSAAEVIRQSWGEGAGERIARIKGLGAEEGLALDLERARPANTFDAHRLVHLAAGQAGAAMERLLAAYHVEGRDIADRAVLSEVGQGLGLDGAAVAALWEGDDFADAVRADEELARARGINGVPMLVINDGTPVSGVQEVAVLRGLLGSLKSSGAAAGRR